MERKNNILEGSTSSLSLFFPSRTRKYVRLTGEQAYESLNNILSEVSSLKKPLSTQKESLMSKARLNGFFGATVTVKVLPEGDVSSIDLVFSYKRAVYASLLICAAVILLEFMVFRNMFTILGIALIIPLIYTANSSANNFLNLVNGTLPLIEKEFAQKALLADRERWKAQPKDTEALYRKLSEKHTKTWGNTKVLEYKVSEYQKLGLTRSEAIRKTAEEEGVD
ncbi:MAG: hypothetical protein QXI71_02835 [Candidatus Bathyarchaeia archaeon]|nr:hypothetical protein [Candidatus Bathyarchaeota archaeon]